MTDPLLIGACCYVLGAASAAFVLIAWQWSSPKSWDSLSAEKRQVPAVPTAAAPAAATNAFPTSPSGHEPSTESTCGSIASDVAPPATAKTKAPRKKSPRKKTAAAKPRRRLTR